MLINKLLNKYPNIIPEEATLFILDSKYSACIDKNGKYTKHTSHIDRRVHFVRNGGKMKNAQD